MTRDCNYYKKSFFLEVEKNIAKLIQRNRVYQNTVKIIQNVAPVEATVTIYTNGSVTRSVQFSAAENASPTCCGYAAFLDGYPCLYGVVVICKKNGSRNVHQFVKKRNSTK